MTLPINVITNHCKRHNVQKRCHTLEMIVTILLTDNSDTVTPNHRIYIQQIILQILKKIVTHKTIKTQ
jgi:hypothetical protein